MPGTNALLLAATLAFASAAQADCRLELELLGSDLGKVKITQTQGQQLAPFVDEALRYCRTGHDQLAVQSIEKARNIARIPKRDELDPEPVPDTQIRTQR
jgi:hypothetical protein